MSPEKELLVGIIDCLPESEVSALLAVAREFLVDDDDIATPDDLEAIRAAREEYARGEFYTDKDITWD